MKRTIKSIAAIMVVLTLCLGLLAGCAGGSPVGTWKISSVEMMGATVDPAAAGYGDDASTMTFNEDGTITSAGQTSGNWTLNGSELTITESGVSITCEYTGSNIILDMGFVKATYVRA
ncbi:MAG: hypothetical protein E7485_03180 [Ruminococcaceae bacterium]|nr:hypothetical protein [Oscillospiraceae bacterium]